MEGKGMIIKNKKIIHVGLLMAFISHGAWAGLERSSFAQVLGYVPVKTTMCVGLGLIGACAYQAYKLPELQAKLDAAKAQPLIKEPTKPTWQERDVKAETELVTKLRKRVQDIRIEPAKVTLENAQALKECVSTLQQSTIDLTENAIDSINRAVIYMSRAGDIVNTSKAHSCKDSGCESLCSIRASYAESLLQCDKDIDYWLKTFDEDCADIIDRVAKYSSQYDVKKMEYDQQLRDYTRKVKHVAWENKRMLSERNQLTKSIAWNKIWSMSLGLSGASLILLAGISKYCKG